MRCCVALKLIADTPPAFFVLVLYYLIRLFNVWKPDMFWSIFFTYICRFMQKDIVAYDLTWIFHHLLYVFVRRYRASLGTQKKKKLEAARIEGGMRWVVISAFSCRFSPRKLYIIFCCAYNAPKEMTKLYNHCKLIVWIIMHSQTQINALFVACCPSQMPKFLKTNPAFNQRMNQTKFWC